MSNTPPVVLVFSAHDPSGAAGLQADIEAITRNGARCVSVITALTCQNTRTFNAILPQDPLEFRRQAETLLADIKVDAVKIGLIGSSALVTEIADIVNQLDRIPAIIDPVLHSGSGTDLATATLISSMREQLIPTGTILTPNHAELMRLGAGVTPAESVSNLHELGCDAILVTGADTPGDAVINTLHMPGEFPLERICARLPGVYHGSGCTLAATLAARMALGEDIVIASDHALRYTWEALRHGFQLGGSQLHPDRFYDP